MKEKVFILGGSGMLGQELVSLFSNDEQYEVVAPTRDELNVTNIESLRSILHELKPSYIINAVAYNAVDLCEDNDKEYEKALFLNKDLPHVLSEIAKNSGSILVHYSTDYVFGDNEMLPGGFTEDTVPRPNSRYGVSKYLGERAVLESCEKVYVIRLSRLFGKPAKNSGKKSFFETMLSLSETKNEIQAVDDEISCFTYAPDLAQATRTLLVNTLPYGTYHLVNEGASSWHGGLSSLFSHLGKKTIIHKVNGNLFTRKAKRPVFSVLANTKRPKLRNYQEALQDYIVGLN